MCTFNIREGVTWHDGTPLTSKDVAFTYRFMLDNKIGAYNNYLPFEPTFETPDDQTLIWKMSKPNLSPLAPPWIPILPQHIWEQYDGDAFTAQASSRTSRPSGRVPSSSSSGRRASSGGWRRTPTTGTARRTSTRSSSGRSTTRRRWRWPCARARSTSCPALIPSLAKSLEDAPNVGRARGRGARVPEPRVQLPHRQDQHRASRRCTTWSCARRSPTRSTSRRWSTACSWARARSAPRSWCPATDGTGSPRPTRCSEFDLDLARSMLDDAGYLDTDGDGVREMPGGGEPLQLEILDRQQRVVVAALGQADRDLARRGRHRRRPAAHERRADERGLGATARSTPTCGAGTRTRTRTSSCRCSRRTSASAGATAATPTPRYDQLYAEQQRPRTSTSGRPSWPRCSSSSTRRSPEVILYYESDLEAYRTDTFTNWVRHADAGRVLRVRLRAVRLHGGPAGRSATTAPGSPAARGTIPLWVWGAGALVSGRSSCSRSARCAGGERTSGPELGGSAAGGSVRRYVARKVLGAARTLVFVLLVNFFLFRVMPGSPVDTMARNQRLSPDEKAALIADFGLDEPLLAQLPTYGVGHRARQPRLLLHVRTAGDRDDRCPVLADGAARSCPRRSWPSRSASRSASTAVGGAAAGGRRHARRLARPVLGPRGLARPDAARGVRLDPRDLPAGRIRLHRSADRIGPRGRRPQPSRAPGGDAHPGLRRGVRAGDAVVADRRARRRVPA